MDFDFEKGVDVGLLKDKLYHINNLVSKPI